MKKEIGKMRFYILGSLLSFLFVYFSISCYAGKVVILDRNHDERICYQDSVLSLPLVAGKSISLPLIDSCLCIVEREQYEEGMYYVCSYKSQENEGVIIVVDGALIEFPADKYTCFKQTVADDREIRHGVCDSGYWRKDIWKYSSIKIYYDYIKFPEELDMMFNHAIISGRIKNANYNHVK